MFENVWNFFRVCCPGLQTQNCSVNFIHTYIQKHNFLLLFIFCRVEEPANFLALRLRLLTFFPSGSGSWLFFSSGSGSKEPKTPSSGFGSDSGSPAMHNIIYTLVYELHITYTFPFLKMKICWNEEKKIVWMSIRTLMYE